MRIVHFSDWHASIQPLPEADLYVCTGDMYPNTRGCFWEDKGPESSMQLDYAIEHTPRYAALLKFEVPLLLVRGNHDFTNLTPLFEEHAGTVFEFVQPSTFKFGGLTFGGFRGVPPINGVWADEMSERALEAACEALGPVDVLVTHGPAYGYLDLAFGGDKIGSKAQRTYLDRGGARAHLFGHVHQSNGQQVKNRIQLSNAATTVNVVEIDDVSKV